MGISADDVSLHKYFQKYFTSNLDGFILMNIPKKSEIIDCSNWGRTSLLL